MERAKKGDVSSANFGESGSQGKCFVATLLMDLKARSITLASEIYVLGQNF